MNKPNDNILSEQINDLIIKLDQVKSDLSFCSTSFSGSTELMIKELKNEREKVDDHLKDLNNSIKSFKESSSLLTSATRVISVLPEKINEKLSKLPKNFNSSIADTIPDLSQDLASRLKKELESLQIQAEALINTTNSNITNNLHVLGGETKQIHYNMQHEINVYKKDIEQIINRSVKSRIRNFFWTVLISSGVSAFVAISTFWLIVRV